MQGKTNPAPASLQSAPLGQKTNREWHAIRTIFHLWRKQGMRLAGGIILALGALVCSLALMQTSGLRLAGCVMGEVIIATATLKWIGGSRIVLRYAERLFAHDAMFRALADLRVWFFRSLARGGAAGLGFRHAGDMLSRLVSDIGALDGLYLRIVLPLICALVTFPALVILIARQNLLLGLIIGALFACTAFVIPWRIARSGNQAASQMAQELAHLRISILDLVGGLREIRAFGAEGRMLAHVQAADSKLLKSQMALSRRAALAGAGAYLAGQAAIFALLIGLVGVGGLHLPALQGIGLLFLCVAAFESATALTRAGLQAGTMGAAAVRVVEVATTPSTVTAANSQTQTPTSTDIHIRNVKFRWSDSRPWVFDGLTLDIPAGARIAILGPSGTGKSSLAAMLLRAAAPQEGQICMGQVDISCVAPDILRRQIAWLSQATHLFDDTIRANLLLGRPDATEADLWQALDDAAVSDVVRTLPDGLDTWLGEGGVRLSGGQGRRIALARTLLTQAPILILDEPATGLDAQTEQEFLKTLNTISTGRTVILIAHRLTGVEKLDRIWRLSGGVAKAAVA